MSLSPLNTAKALAATALVVAAVVLGIPRASGATVPTVRWSTVQPSTSPPALGYAASAFDADTNTVVLFGGVTSAGNPSGDTWIWNGRVWTEHAPASGSPAPPPRELASMAFDPVLHQLILFGGRAADGTLLSDTWAWNGVSWYQLAQGVTTGPAAREAASMAFDPAGNIVLFGGTGYASTAQPQPTSTVASQSAGTKSQASVSQLTNPQALSDTWTWNGKSWTEAVATGPSARSGAALAYDSTARATVLFSGETEPSAATNPTLATDTWTWNGKAWTLQKPTTSPSPRFEAVLTDAPTVKGALLLDGNGAQGALSDAWVWSAGNWVQARVTSPAPGRVGAAGAFDSSHSVTTIFGGIGGSGVTLADTDLVTAALPVPVTPSSTTTTTSTKSSTSPSSTRAQSPTTTKPATSETTTTAPTTIAGGAEVSIGSTVLSLQASLHTVHAGGVVHLSGSGFKPASFVVITFASPSVVLSRSPVGPDGTFSTNVTVPTKAPAGNHHLEAAGYTPAGSPAQLVAAVYVTSPDSNSGTSTVIEAAMVTLAVLIPVGAWLTMGALGRRRNRNRPAQG